MQVSILGALEVRRGDDAVAVSGARVRALLARLALDAGRDVSAERLIEAVWDGDPPGDAAHALQALVSRLRRALGAGGAVASGAAGYRLAIAPEAVDAVRFEALARDGAAALRAGDAARAATVLRDALALWRGPALGELGDLRFASLAGDRLDDLRLTATADRIDAELRLGHGGDLVAELDALTAAHPLHERLAGQRLRALAAAGRSADALEAYEQLRVRLDTELGAVPSPELQAAQLAVVSGTAAPEVPVVRAPARRSNLRFGVTSFVGRTEDVAALEALLRDHRLVTLIGPGGAGKTRLAGEAGALEVARLHDGVWMVELAAISDPHDLGAGVLGALGLREARLMATGAAIRTTTADGGADAVTHLLDVLAERETLLILDNCEHLLGAAAVLADQLLAHCPALRILATSREPLGIAGERLVPVTPLGLPPAEATAAEALAHPAVRLFADRAAAVAPGFTVDDATVAAVVEICRRLDGLPLALELAAARLRSLPVAQIAARLDDRFRLLTGGNRAALPRQRTLRAVVDWSWDLLSEPERALARRAAVFPAGVTPESAAAVCAGAPVPADEVPDLLAALVDRSLLVLVDGARYRMLETIREYGLERLAEAGEVEAVRTAHARHFAALVDEAEPHLRHAEQLPWLRLLQAERENVLAALRWFASTRDAAATLRLAVALCWFWLLSGSPGDAIAALRAALAVPGEADPLDRLIAETLVHDAEAAEQDDVRERARAVLDRLEALDLGPRPAAVAAMPILAWVTGDRDRFRRLCTTALAHPDPWVRAWVPLSRAQIAENEGDVPHMREHFEAALDGFRAVGDRWGLAATLSGLGGVHVLEDDLDAAARVLEEARGVLAELGADADHALLHLRLSDVRQRQGDLPAAVAHGRRAHEAADLGSAESAITGAALARLLWCTDVREEAEEVMGHALATVERAPPSPERGHAEALVRASAAMLALDAGRPEEARTLLRAAYPAALGTQDLPIAAIAGVAVAALAAHDGAPREAAEMLGAAARLRGSADTTNPAIAELAARLRATLGDAGFGAAFAAGRALDRAAAQARLEPDGYTRRP